MRERRPAGTENGRTPRDRAKTAEPGPVFIYTDGGFNWAKRLGGWGAVIIEGGRRREVKGSEQGSSSNRMELTAAIAALTETLPASQVTLSSDSQYLVFSMSKGWERRANLDLWQQLDRLAADRHVQWEWLARGQHPEQQRAHELADEAASLSTPQASAAPPDGARMVDVAAKPETLREAVARGRVTMKPETFQMVQEGRLPKGDVLGAARLAGIMAAKRTYELIPLCHPLMITSVAVDLVLDEGTSSVEISASARVVGRTGAEMEALTAVAVAGLTIYDMAKSVDPTMQIQDIRLAMKSGGKSGEVVLE